MPRAKRTPRTKLVSTGSKDAQGKLDGRGTQCFPSGDVFAGRYRHGEKHGRGMWTFSDGSRLSGTFRADELHGQGTYHFPDGSELVAAYRDGQLSGASVKRDEDGDVDAAGAYSDNVRCGRWYQVADEYGAFLVGSVSEDGEWSGDDIAYVYPDKSSALIGRFEAGQLQEAVHGTCTGDDVSSYTVTRKEQCQQQQQQQQQRVEAFTSTESVICMTPLLADQYETATVFVAKSPITDAGEGLFAKRPLRAGELAAYYNGVRLSHSVVDGRDWSENGNCISLDDDVVIDVPEKFSDTSVYCATLGHKANHSFSPNACYAPCQHPVYGTIKCIHAICDVNVGEEITVHYDYHHKSENGSEQSAPQWYLSCKPA